MTVLGYAPGAFDMFHIGHLNILRRARLECDHLIAGVATDEVVHQAKGKRPIIPFAERLEIVRSVRHVDEAVPDPHVDKLDSWRELRFDVLFKGDDWRGTERGNRLEAELGAVGARVVYFPYTLSTSSSALRRLMSIPS
ncbi:glycerol-3-phosphate cytidylyltransferase [Amycolatopsis arida]|uniref:Glycerol-3-phosphate cytidylyltransferase n=1 Tax=Amycolatopsis arida TaxID=587909 RepID=A0A1I5Z6Q9_9PSEU|nr:adenylyltransferase/cytidyltransferase family protein [Amycolatopsis arida]TDX90185.1 glycerol-3-phosphate cytidylyltransferase [Amycolatopsis arida]SFQ52156.1 glycerol-3-phosphate cytidylyltransferase [Amycolatopsis arida]